jgi:hypothetical protein
MFVSWMAAVFESSVQAPLDYLPIWGGTSLWTVIVGVRVSVH